VLLLLYGPPGGVLRGVNRWVLETVRAGRGNSRRHLPEHNPGRGAGSTWPEMAVSPRRTVRYVSLTLNRRAATVTGKAVLVVDDEEVVRKLLQRTLESEGYRVLVARDGDEALAILDNFAIDLVLTDIRMPEMDGRKLGRLISELPGAPHVIYASGSDKPPSGVDETHYLAKPFKSDKLLGTIASILKQ
jgi:two-component system chemotaxis response regulator CheY